MQNDSHYSEVHSKFFHFGLYHQTSTISSGLQKFAWLGDGRLHSARAAISIKVLNKRMIKEQCSLLRPDQFPQQIHEKQRLADSGCCCDNSLAGLMFASIVGRSNRLSSVLGTPDGKKNRQGLEAERNKKQR